MNKASTPGHLGDKNKKLIIELLKEKGPLSRADISRETGMSFPAVSSNVQYLLSNQYLIEYGQGQNSMGRKSTLLAFNEKKGYVLGIDLGRSSTSLIIVDLLGEPYFHISKTVKIKQASSNIIEYLDKLISNALRKCGIGIHEIVSIGIGIPGVLDPCTGKMILAPFVESSWNKYDVLKEMKARFQCPIIVENSVNLGALGEKWRGSGKEYANFVYINYSIGIGSAMIINNELYTGNNGAAGEIGYASPSYEYFQSQYHEAGVLEQLISGEALDKRIREMSVQPRSLKELFENNDPELDGLRSSIVQEIDRHFFIVLLGIAAMMNPAAIILSGNIGMNIGTKLVDKWSSDLRAHIPFPPELMVSQIGSYANVYGASRHAMQYIEDEFCASQ